MINLEEIEVVSKAELKELRACKRKLDETGPELLECKRRLEETRAKQQMDRKKWEQLSQMITKSVQFQRKDKILLNYIRILKQNAPTFA